MSPLPLPSELSIRMCDMLYIPAAFGRLEREQAAALYILTCVSKGDTWQPLSWSDICEFVRPNLGKDRWRIFGSRFFRPDPRDLVEKGFALFDEEERLTLTDDSILRCAKSLGLKSAGPIGGGK